MENKKQNIIDKYKELKNKLGYPPSSREFYKESGITQHSLTKIYGSTPYVKLVLECGDKPAEFSSEKVPIEKIFIQWGEIMRKERRVPTLADWLFYKCTPHHSRIFINFGFKWKDIPRQFIKFAQGKKEWEDIIKYVNVVEPMEEETFISSNNEVNDNGDYRIYLPPVISLLETLSKNENKSLDFEKKVNLAFQLIGFQVDDLGQGTGRNPDGIAKCRQYHYAIIIDAKSRKEKYTIGTEDRKFIEYIKKYGASCYRVGKAG